MIRRLLIGTAVLAVAGVGAMTSLTSASAQDKSAYMPPSSEHGVTNRLGCKLVGDDGMETAVGFWPCVQSWVYADFGALKSGATDEVPAYVVAQMKSSQLSERMGRIYFDNWTIRRIERDGEDYLSVAGWGFKKNGYQMQMENFVPFKHGEFSTLFLTTTPDDSETTEYIMKCFLDLEGLE